MEVMCIFLVPLRGNQVNRECLFKFSYAGHISGCMFLDEEIFDLNFLKILLNREVIQNKLKNDPT